jgi:hypothetical protein
MPDTLGVTADEDAWSTGLVAGFAEAQATLFEDEPPAIRTLDRVAEETNTDAYRDLLHEIDRAFDSFERSAVRHGWLADHEAHSDAPDPADAKAAKRCNSARGRIDLPTFVAATIAQETGHRVGNRTVLRLPTEWRAGLDGLPGFDSDAGVLRVTDDRSLLRDRYGRSLAYLGRTHPVVRRACSGAQRMSGIGSDARVSVARTDGRTPPSVLFTYGAELRSGQRIEMQWIIAVMLSQDNAAKEITTSDQWLRLADFRHDKPSPHDAWQRLFAGWVPAHGTDVAAVADADLQDWLQSRCKDICGAYVPRTGDLFGTDPPGPNWQVLAAPLDRLAGFAADANNQPNRRRDAGSMVELFQQRGKEHTASSAMQPPALRPLGLLMLVPPSLA